jgi:hypothetical protein
MLPPPSLELRLVAGDALSYSFGRIFDYELDNVTIEFNTGNAAKFIDFDEETLTMNIK